MNATDRLQQQLSFLAAADGLKTVERRSRLADDSRLENSAEHSWHVALYALVLAEYALERVDAGRVVKMLLVHDLVEVEAGDTYVYDPAGLATKLEREQAAATRIFGLLPEAQGADLRSLWEEFEARATPDARFANAMDRLSPVLLNRTNQGRSWRSHGVVAEQVRAVNSVVGDAAPQLGDVVRAVIDEAVREGWIEGA
ncbi:MAG: HD domain-containing protein [Candidatus Dormibacteraeota bacterium]|nr:HD domain-containing protein [Candidatus Dormibacteraeota bacterium]